MVVFTCNHCGDSLQKPKVAKHYQTTCKNPIALTCVDCFKDFNLQEYVVHTKCVTELDRYSAKGTAPKILKGEMKQTEWVNTVNLIIEQQTKVKPSVKNVLETIKSFSNIPKKKVKFFNFMKSTSGQRINLRDIEAVWELLEKHKLSQNKNAQNNKKLKNGDDEAKKETSENADESSEPKKSKKKKKKSNETQSEEAVENGTTAEEPASEEKTSKKKRKSKSKDSESNQAEVIPQKKQKLSETAEVATQESPKKKKKRQSMQESEEAPQKVTTPENGVVKNESSKKKKKNKQNSVQEVKNNESQETPQKVTVAENGVEKNESSKKKRKSMKKTEEMNNSTSKENQNGVANESFSFQPLILDVLAKKPKGISKEVLLTKVLKKFESLKGPIVNKKSLLKKYNKNLKSLQNVSCNNDTYSLIE